MVNMAKLKYLTGATFTLKCSILYPIDPKTPKFKKYLYFVWAFLFISSFVTVFMQCLMHLCTNKFDLIEEATIVMNFVIYSALFLILLFFHQKSESFVTFVGNINENFETNTDNNFEEIAMEQSVKLSDKIAYFWTLTVGVGSVIPTLISLAAGNKEMLIPGWLPYDSQKSPFFEITYVWQSFCLITMGIIYSASDMIYPCITILMGQQFQILANNFKNNLYATLLKFGIEKEVIYGFSTNLRDEDFQTFYKKYKHIFSLLMQPQVQKTNLQYLRKNIKHHVLLLKYCDDINDILSSFLMVKLSAVVFNLIFIGFNIIITTDKALMLSFCNFFLFAVTDLFIYTYSGQILTQNADFLSTLYESPWYLCDINFQKLLIIVQMRVKRMVYTKAGNFFPLAAPTFITFMRAAFSYITLLKELTEREVTDS